MPGADEKVKARPEKKALFNKHIEKAAVSTQQDE